MKNLLNFKESLSTQTIEFSIEDVKKEIFETMDTIINTEFNNVVFGIQKRYKNISKELQDKIVTDIDDLEFFEVDEFKKEVYETLELEFKNITKNILKQIPEVDK